MKSCLRVAGLLLCLFTPYLQANESLYQAINQRLMLMKDVAAYKWLHKLPIEAVDRESVVINRATFDGLQYGLTTQSSAGFFRAQIEAAKDIQHCWHQYWHVNAPPAHARDLGSDIRPELLRLGTLIISRLTDNKKDRVFNNKDRALFDQTISTECLSTELKNHLYTAVMAITRYPNKLVQVQESGILRVGTTGDYAPFSWSAGIPDDLTRSDTEMFTGIDIDLARKLADSLSTKVHFVKTTWPTLMTDLVAGRYDIAMSGVSITESRKVQASFTSPYHRGGKTPVSRCQDKSLYASLNDINQSNVRVIVNPGGTNEKFLDRQLTRATKILHGDNRTIFDEILKGRADVMVTDAIEARLMTSQLAGLCATMPGKTLTVQDKGYMMPKDPVFNQAVERWLKQMQNSGEVEKIFARHLP